MFNVKSYLYLLFLPLMIINHFAHAQSFTIKPLTSSDINYLAKHRVIINTLSKKPISKMVSINKAKTLNQLQSLLDDKKIKKDKKLYKKNSLR